MRWFESASAYTGFHEKLMRLFLPYVTARGTLVDLGCGAGMIDYLLAEHIQTVTCVDQNVDVLRFVVQTAKKRDIQNIQTYLADAKELEGQWDTVLMSFFGRLDDQIEHYLSLCRENVIAIVHAQTPENPSAGTYHPPKCNTVEKTVEGLGAKNIRYTLLRQALEYGQPFASRDEAAQYAAQYQKNPPDLSVDAYLDQVLQHTGDSAYPYYLPNLKQFGIFVIAREDNAHI